MNNLVIIGHPDKKSFCHNGIFSTITKILSQHHDQNIETIDLYEDKLHEGKKQLIETYKKKVLWAERIYFISPIWWFRLTPKMETFFDEVFTPGFAYSFKPITKSYGLPIPKLRDKKVRTYITHGAPALPVIIMYLNSVKLRLVMGVYSFVFGWKPSLFIKTKQFWSVPFKSLKKRKKYLEIVQKDVLKDVFR